MRFTTLTEEEIHEIKRLHESLLSKSSHGLFHSVGKIIGENIAKEIGSSSSFFEDAARILRERGIVEDIRFEEKKVTAKGCIEVKTSDAATCDVLRGIIISLYRNRYNRTAYCEETSCESTGAPNCIFEIRAEVI